MPNNLSYINARGEEIVLDHTEANQWLWELYGREGLEAPALDYTEIQYGDGGTDIIAVTPEPREVTFYFAAKQGTPHLRETLAELKQKLIQTGTSTDWGKLKIKRKDGRVLTLDCVYTGGLDDFTRESWSWVKFPLTFRAVDPYFYDDFELSWTMQQDDRDGYLFMEDDLFFADAEIVDTEPDAQTLTGETDPGNLYWDNETGKYYAIKPASSLYMISAQSNASDGVYLNGEKAYPTITINGPAENISITNKATGRKIALASSVKLDINERITIYTQPRKRKITMRDKSGTTTNLMSKLTSASSLDWWLMRGSNVIEFNNSATTPETWFRLTYREGYLSAE